MADLYDPIADMAVLLGPGVPPPITAIAEGFLKGQVEAAHAFPAKDGKGYYVFSVSGKALGTLNIR